MLTGRAWSAATARVPGFEPVEGDRVVLVGARDFNEGEESALRSSGVRLAGPERLGAAGSEVSTARTHLHIDLDVLDPAVGRANGYAVAGGLTTEEVCAVIAAVAARSRIVSLSMASYDPAVDADGAVADAALRVLELAAELLAGQSEPGVTNE